VISFTTYMLTAINKHWGQWGLQSCKECIWKIYVSQIGVCLSAFVQSPFREMIGQCFQISHSHCQILLYSLVSVILS